MTKKVYEIAHYNKYLITRKGDVYSISGVLQEPAGNFCGHPVYALISDDGEYIRFVFLCRLMMSTFYGDAPYQIVFRDNCTKNCSRDNLSYKIDSLDVSDDKSFIMINDDMYKKIAISPSYYISKNGLVFSLRSNKFLARKITTNGYIQYDLWEPNDTKYCYAHLLVYDTWVGDRRPEMCIDHKNMHKWDASLENLEQITRSENNQRALAYYKNHKSSSIFWCEGFIRTICRLMEQNYSVSEICDWLSLTSKIDRAMIIQLCSSLRHGKSWKEISCEYNLDGYALEANRTKSSRKYDKLMVDQIISFINKGYPNVVIANELGIPRQTVNGYRRKIKN